MPLSASIATNGFKSIKQAARDTISVTGSARYPIAANLATWRLSVSAQKPTPARSDRWRSASKVAQVDAFLAHGGLSGDDISKPPIEVEQVSVSVPTGLKKPAFRHVPAWHVSQVFVVETTQIDTLERIGSHVGDLLAAGTDVSDSRIDYLSTKK